MTLRPSPPNRRWPRLSMVLGAVAVAALPGVESAAPIRISDLQGRGHVSPFVGRHVSSSGVVTSVVATVATVQAPDGDGDPATSDAIVIEFSPPVGLRTGDRVTFSGTVRESVPGGPGSANLSVTTVTGARVRVERRGVSLPRPVPLGGPGAPPAPDIISPDELPVNLRDEQQARANRFDPDADAIDYWESLEGMRVTVPAPVAVSALQTYGAGGSELYVLANTGDRIAPARRTTAGGILLQSGPDNRGSQNSERIQIQIDAALVPGLPPPIAVGDRMDDVTGVVRYAYGNYEVAATAGIRHRPRPPSRAAARRQPAADRLMVASYNVLNLSPQPEDSIQRAVLGRQTVQALGAPEILALQEIQDDSGERDDGVTTAAGTLRALADAIRAAGGPIYRAAEVAPADGRQGGAPGGNIRNAFLYDPARVALLSHHSLTPAHLAAAGVIDTAIFRDSRDPLVGVFEQHGRHTTIVNNHLSSRYGSTPAYGAIQPFVQAGEEARAAQVAALRAYVAGLLARDPAARVVVLGDMNTFEFADELATLLPGEPPVLHPLSQRVPGRERYSYNFEGNSQALDHAFVTRSLLAGAELEYLHLNADFYAAPGRMASDHDPVLLQLPR